MGAIEGKVPKWGGGGEEVDMGDVLFGSKSDKPMGETEWEVSRHESVVNARLMIGVCHRRPHDEERVCAAWRQDLRLYGHLAGQRERRRAGNCTWS